MTPPPRQQFSLPVDHDTADDSIPFARLGNPRPTTADKPIALTVVGILSLVLSALGGLFCLWGFILSGNVYAISNIPATAFPTQSATVSLTVTNQLTVVNTLNSIHPLTIAQRESLSNYLAATGELVFPSNGQALSPAAVRLSVLKTTTEPPTDPPTDSSNSAGSTVVFTLVTGELRVSDVQTDFAAAQNATVPAVTSPAWLNSGSGSIAQTMIANVQAAIAPGTLTPQQLQTLTNQFTPTAANQGNFPTSATLQSAVVNNNGDLVITWSEPTGIKSMVIDSMGNSPGASVGSSMGAVIARKLSPIVLRDTLLALSGNALLLLYLFIIGIVALTGSRRVRWPHMVYALLQIPLAFFGAYEMTLLCSLYGRANNAPGQTMGVAIVIGTIICFYPISLLFIMNMQAVRRYVAAS